MRAAPKNNNLAPIVRPLKKRPTAPIRSCLVVKTAAIVNDDQTDTDHDNANTETTADTANTIDTDTDTVDNGAVTTQPKRPVQANGPKRTKKRVVFADDQGYALTETRIMSEPSSVPPTWSLEFLAHVTQGMVSPVPVEQWTVSFRQPASDYLDFR